MTAHYLPPARWVEPADPTGPLGHLLPPSALTLIRVAGCLPAVALMKAWPGVLVMVPKHPDTSETSAQRWRALVEIVGEPAMRALAAHYGGSALQIPTCDELLREKRARWIRARFDDLTSRHGPALSGWAAVQEINLALAQAGWPLTLREVQKVVDRAVEDATPTPAQAALPFGAPGAACPSPTRS